jgi:hypothetical protein
MVICDEAALMPEEAIAQVIFPRQSTMGACAVFLNTSWGKDPFFYTVRVTLQRTEGQNITSRPKRIT